MIPVETNPERRKRKLADLCRLVGGYTLLAEPAGLSPAYIEQICKGVLLPAKKGGDGLRSARSLGDSAARSLEGVHNLPRGWFDNDADPLDMTSMELLLLGYFRALDQTLQTLVLENLQKTAEDRRQLQEQWQLAIKASPTPQK